MNSCGAHKLREGEAAPAALCLLHCNAAPTSGGHHPLNGTTAARAAGYGFKQRGQGSKTGVWPPAKLILLVDQILNSRNVTPTIFY